MAVEPELSEREQEIIRLVATGASNKEIAQKLVISPNTVKVHLRNIFGKIGVVSRTEATLYALRENLVQSEGINISPDVVVEAGLGLAEQPLPWYRQKGNLAALIIMGGLILVAVIFLLVGGLEWLNPPAVPPSALSQPQRWSVLSQLPEGISALATVQYENSIILIGGSTGGGVSGAVRRYDSATDIWRKLADKPTPVSAAQAGVLGEKIFVPGGVGAEGQPLDVVEVYDPRSDEWKNAARLPAPLSDYALAVFEGRLFLFGGWDGSRYVDSIYLYDPLEDQWSVRESMDEPFGLAAAVVSGSKIYLIGGTDGEKQLKDVRVYYPNREAGGEAAWERREELPEPLSGLNAVALVNAIYVTAQNSGEEGGQTLLRYNEQSDDWEVLETAPQALGSRAALVALDTKIHILGGQAGGQPSAAHLTYQAIYTVLIPAVSR